MTFTMKGNDEDGYQLYFEDWWGLGHTFKTRAAAEFAVLALNTAVELDGCVSVEVVAP